MRQTKEMRQPIASKVGANAPQVGARRKGPSRARRRHVTCPVHRQGRPRHRRGSLRPDRPDELLVHAHRDQHPVEVTAQFLGSRVLQLTGREGLVESTLRRLERARPKVRRRWSARACATPPSSAWPRMLGVVNRDVSFKFREFTHLSEKEVKARVEGLQREARATLCAPAAAARGCACCSRAPPASWARRSSPRPRTNAASRRSSPSCGRRRSATARRRRS